MTQTFLVLTDQGAFKRFELRHLDNEKSAKNCKLVDYNTTFNLDNFRIKGMRLLDNQHTMILFLQDLAKKPKRAESQFNRVALVDVEHEFEGKLLAGAEDIGSFSQVSSNFDGTVSVVVSQSEEHSGGFELGALMIENLSKSSDKKKLVSKTLTLDGKDCVEGDISAIVLLYMRDTLVLADDLGFLYTARLDVESLSVGACKMIGNINSEVTRSKEFYRSDFVIRMTKSWDQKYLICATEKCRLCFVRTVPGETFELAFEVQLSSPVMGLKLSLDGRVLATSGLYYDSVRLWPLDKLDERSFGHKRENFETLCHQYSGREKVTYKSVEERIMYYKYGDLKERLAEMMRRETVNNQDKEQIRRSNNLKINDRRRRDLGDDDSDSEYSSDLS